MRLFLSGFLMVVLVAASTAATGAGQKQSQDMDRAGQAGKIMPVIKSGEDLDAIRKQVPVMKKTGGMPALAYEKIGSDLYLLYVLDRASSMTPVTRDGLEKLGIKMEGVRSIAEQNLVTYYKKIRATFRKVSGQGAGTVYYLAAKEKLEASALLLADRPLWNGQSLAVKGKPVVFVPARNVLLVTGSGDAKGLARASSMAANFYKNYGYGISPHGYVRSGQGWVLHKR